MKTFNNEQFMTLVSSTNALFKLPEQINGFYLLIELETDEISTEIGTDKTIFLQCWELHDNSIINGKEYFLFKMWGQLPDHMIGLKDLSEHEGKEIAVPIQSIFQILNNLGTKAPHVFNEENLIQTQVIKHYLKHNGDEDSDSEEMSVSKNVDREKSIEYCNNGIEAKRNGAYKESIDYYKKAINSDYSNPASYMNLAKVLIGIGKYNEAIRNILTYVHLKLPEIDESQFNDVNLFYKLKKSHKISHNHRRVRKLFKKQPLIKQISVDVNATFNAGLCYTMINSNGLKLPNNISDDLIDNEKNILLGQQPNGVNLRQTEFANMIHVIGALFLYNNLNNVLKNEYDISNYYLNTANDLNDI